MTNCWVCVNQDEIGVYEFCGEYKGDLQPGCNTLGMDCCGACIVTQIISNRITENIVTSETKTEDNVFVRVSCAVQQQPKASRVKDCVYRLRNPRAQIESYVGDVVRGQVPNMTLEEVFINKDAIADAVGQKIKHSMADFGWSILQSLVVNVDPDQSVKTAMNKLEAANKQREASEITAEAQKVVRVRLAEANAESKFLQGQGISLQRAAIINGLRDSVGTEERELSPQMVSELLLITQYYDTLEKMADARGKTIFMPNGIETISETTRQIRAGIMGGGGASMGAPTSIKRTTPYVKPTYNVTVALSGRNSPGGSEGSDDFGFSASPKPTKKDKKKKHQAKPQPANTAQAAGPDIIVCNKCGQKVMSKFAAQHTQHCKGGQ